ncbi:MAG: IS1595 family transposase [Saprospiraceae bacterium]|nr:IS1595 family transposase [Saprospiraceae bacterium]
MIYIMEAKFKSLSIFTFQEQFPDEESCYAYLANLKWANGFSCKKCGHQRSCRGVGKYDRQCTKCNYLETPTSGTLFHKMKFSILKAFWIVYFTATNKKGISSTELSRKLQLRQKTCWLFRMKVLQAMASSDLFPLQGQVEMDEYIAGHEGKGSGDKKKRKKLVIIALEKAGRGVSRIYASQISRSDKKNIQSFIARKIDAQAQIKTDAWSTHTALSKKLKNVCPQKSKAQGGPFERMRRIINGIQVWLRGTHGHATHLQYYLNEYCFRFNRHLMKEGLFENLIGRMVRHKPRPYKLLIAYAPI